RFHVTGVQTCALPIWRSRRRLPDPVRLPVVADHADHPRRPRGAAGRVHEAVPVPAQARARPGTQASRKLTRALSRGPAAPPAAAGTGRSRRPAPNPLSARPGTGPVRSPPALGAGPGLVPDRSVPERAVLAPGVVDDHVRGPVEDLDRAGGRIEPPPAGVAVRREADPGPVHPVGQLLRRLGPGQALGALAQV